MIQLESQPSGAPAQQERGSRDPGLQQLGDTEPAIHMASAARMQGQMRNLLEAKSRQPDKSFERHVHQQRGGDGKEKQTREETDMQELIDLTADSDTEPDLLD